MRARKQKQVSPSGMATASQAVPGEFDSRHLLQVSIIRTICLQQANGSDYLFIWINKRMLTLILRYSVAFAPYGKMRASIRETFFFAEAHTEGGKRQAPVRER